MKQQNTQPDPPIQFRLSLLICSGFIVFWLMSILIASDSLPVKKITRPVSTAYSLLFRQYWHFFTYSQDSQREIWVVLQDSKTGQVTDSLDIIPLSIAERKKRAPFNTVASDIDHLLFGQIRGIYFVVQDVYKHSEGLFADKFQQLQYARQKALQNNACIRHEHNIAWITAWLLNENHISSSGKTARFILKTRYNRPMPANGMDQWQGSTIPYFISEPKPLPQL